MGNLKYKLLFKGKETQLLNTQAPYMKTKEGDIKTNGVKLGQPQFLKVKHNRNSMLLE